MNISLTNIDSFLNGECIKISSETDYQKYMDNVFEECLKNDSYTFKISNSKAYEDINKLNNNQKIELIFWLSNEMITLSERVQNQRWNIDYSQYNICNELKIQLLRQKFNFTDEHYLDLFFIFIKKLQLLTFHVQPILSLAKQLKRQTDEFGLSDDLKSYIEIILTWKEMNPNDKFGYGKIYEPVKVLKTILAKNKNPQATPPFILLNDQFGVLVNQEIENLAASEKDVWYQLFHQCIKAKAGKPTKQFLNETNLILAKIGEEEFKKRIQNWLLFLSKMQTVEMTEVGKDYSGREYHYTWLVYLKPENVTLMKGLVWILAQFTDAHTLSLLSKLTLRCFQRIPITGYTCAALGNACIYALGIANSLEGIGHLSRLKPKMYQANTQDLIQKYINLSAEKLGLTAVQVEELSVPTYGLIDGKRIYDFEDYQFEIEITGIGKVSTIWRKPDGKPQKSAPTFIKNSELLKDKLKATKLVVNEIKQSITGQRDRIDNMYLANHSWKMDKFSSNYIEHGLVSFVAKRLIWQFEEGDKKTEAIFYNDVWQNLNGEKIGWLTNETIVRLWHPIFSEIETVLSWRNRLEELEIKQPMKQAYREVYLLTAAEKNTKSYSNRMAAHILKQYQFNSLAKLRNWSYGMLATWDNGISESVTALRQIPAYDLTAEYWINELQSDYAYSDSGIWLYVSTDQVKFTNGHGTIELADVPPIVFSEIMRDVDMFVGVSSVGNDPQWRDNAGLPQYRDYWQSYSFGDLSEVAKTRKTVLERLLPRLKIRDIAKIEGKFLIVKGKIRTYKIHIGSTNILMTPNEEYLCIVPAQNSENKNDVFLPFEGDKGLSIILSKAFLLADDDKITDSTITSQIRRS